MSIADIQKTLNEIQNMSVFASQGSSSPPNIGPITGGSALGGGVSASLGTNATAPSTTKASSGEFARFLVKGQETARNAQKARDAMKYLRNLNEETLLKEKLLGQVMKHIDALPASEKAKIADIISPTTKVTPTIVQIPIAKKPPIVTPTTATPSIPLFKIIGTPTPSPSPDEQKASFGAGRVVGTHQGKDFAYPQGTPYGTPTGGIIQDYGYDDKAGWWVRIGTDANNYYFMAHFDSLPKEWYQSGRQTVKGETINQGAYIGNVGMTGNAKGTYSHVHLGVKEGGKWIDPSTVMPRWENSSK